MRHFKASEFRCGCGCGLGYDQMQDDILELLDVCREQAGIPFVITSSIRCVAHNAAVGGADRSAHLTGHAVDISAKTGAQRRAILKAALALDAPSRVLLLGSEGDTDPLIYREVVGRSAAEVLG